MSQPTFRARVDRLLYSYDVHPALFDALTAIADEMGHRLDTAEEAIDYWRTKFRALEAELASRTSERDELQSILTSIKDFTRSFGA